MGLMNWLFGKAKTGDKSAGLSSVPGRKARWYFLSVGHAMGPEVFRAVVKDDDFMSIGGGKGLATGKLRVRYYSDAQSQGPPSGQAGFTGAELTRNNAPKQISTISHAHEVLGGGRGSAIMVILADDRFDDFYSRFRDHLNKKYIESGALPIVTLIYTDEGDAADHLLKCFRFEEEGTPVLASGSKVDFFHPS